MTRSPLGLFYRFRAGIGIEAAREYGDYWSMLLVPSIHLAVSMPGEIEAIIAARDKAATEAIKERENVATD